MKITGVRAYPLSIPLRPMRPHSPWLDGMPKQIIVKITTDGFPCIFASASLLA